MKVHTTPFPELLVFEPQVFADDRGSFTETHHAEKYAAAGLTATFVQDGWSRSFKGTLRGLHFQEPRPQGKLVYAVRGAVFDVAVDIRRGSPTFGAWFGLELSEDNRKQFFIPRGFAHGFCPLTDVADLFYKCTDFYVAEADRGIAWDDPKIGIPWPITEAPRLSKKDATSRPLEEQWALPTYP